MKKVRIFVAVVIAAITCIGVSHAQQFNCVGSSTTGLCADTSHGLRAYNGSTTYTFVSVAGFNAQGDGGAGEFYRLGSQPAVCFTTTSTPATGKAGSTNITGLSSTNGLTVGESVSGSGTGIQIQPGTEIASIV